MPIYTSTVTATSNASANTDDTFVELAFAASSAGRIRQVEIYPEAAASAGSSVQCKWRLLRNSAAGATGTAGSSVKKETTMRGTSLTTNLIKNGTSAFSVGANTDIVKYGAFNTFSYDPTVFLAKERADEIYCAASTFFAVVIQCTAVSTVFRVTVTWED